MGLDQYIDDAGPELEAAARSAIDAVIAQVGARSLSNEQRTVLDDARIQLSALSKDSLIELEAKAVEAFEQSLSALELQTLVGFARSAVGRGLFKRIFEAGAEGKDSELSSFTLDEVQALGEWAQQPGFGSLLEKLPLIDTKLQESVARIKDSLETRLLQYSKELEAKLE
jgi:hypothetical protein